jgi:hypothetical protein
MSCLLRVHDPTHAQLLFFIIQHDARSLLRNTTLFLLLKRQQHCHLTHQLVLQCHEWMHLKLQAPQFHIQPVADSSALQQRQRRRRCRQPSSLRDIIILVITPPRSLFAGLREEIASEMSHAWWQQV